MQIILAKGLVIFKGPAHLAQPNPTQPNIPYRNLNLSENDAIQNLVSASGRTHAQQVQPVRRLVLHVRAAQSCHGALSLVDHGQVPQAPVHLLRANRLRFPSGEPSIVPIKHTLLVPNKGWYDEGRPLGNSWFESRCCFST